MSDVRKVNVGRVLDKIQIAVEELKIDDVQNDVFDVAGTNRLQTVFAEYGAAGLQTIVRGRRGDGEVEIRYSRHGMPGALLLNASGTVTDVGSQSKTYVHSVAAELFIAALFGEKELDADTGFADHWRGAAAYAKCLLASSKSGCRSVLKKWKGPAEAADAKVIAGRKEQEQIKAFDDRIRQLQEQLERMQRPKAPWKCHGKSCGDF